MSRPKNYLRKLLRQLEPKHLLGLAVALGISLAIIYFQDEIRSWGRFGYLGAFVVMFLASATLALPTPVVFMTIAFGRTLPDPLLAGLVIGTASALGEMTGYLAGYGVSRLVQQTVAYKQTRLAIRKYGLIALFVMALVPNPIFDLAGIAAGALGIRWWLFLLTVGVGKTLRAIFFTYLGAATR